MIMFNSLCLTAESSDENKMSSSACPTAFNPLGLSIKVSGIHIFQKKTIPKWENCKKMPQLLCFVLSGNFLHQFAIFMVDNSECCDQLILLPLCLGSSSSKHL